MKFKTPKVVAAVLVAGLTFGLTAPAFAQTSTVTDRGTATNVDPANAKARCIQAIDARVDTLAKAQTRLDGASFVTEDHASSLGSIITSTASGLRALRDQIDTSQDPREVVALCKTIGPDYRVYLVVVPQVRLTAGADKIESTQGRIADLTAKFDEAADRAKEAGADVSAAVDLRNRAVQQFDEAIALVDGVADSVIAVTPASFNDGPGARTLEVARETVRTSAGQMKSAWETGQAAVQALKDAIASL